MSTLAPMAVTPHSHNAILSTTATCAALIAIPVILAGCGGGGGGGGGNTTLPPALTINKISLAIATTGGTAPTVDVDEQLVDDSNAVTFQLNGGSTGKNRPRDPGSKKPMEVYDFTVTAVEGMNVAEAPVYVAINPSLDRTLNSATTYLPGIKHFFNRTGFMATETELLRWRNVPYNTMVDQIIDEATYDETTQGNPDAATYSGNDDGRGDSLNRLTQWWMREMVRTKHPILERMTLFWHNLLVVTASDVFEPKPMWNYLDTLRTNALGNYGDLIRAIAKDPAMVMFLDSNSNVKGRPNENFARELLELFTLGEGNGYSEADVVDVARCFTGWGLTSDRQFTYKQDKHDTFAATGTYAGTGIKTVLGQTIDHNSNAITPDGDGKYQVQLDGEHALNVVLARTEVAVYICGKMWDEFIGGTRNTGTITSWANTFRNGNYEIKPLLKVIFKHGNFTSAGQRGNMIRTPVDLHVGLFRAVSLEPNKYGDQHWQAGEEDQRTLYPPNVKGWIGGLTWINAKTLLTRRKHMGWLAWELQNYDKVTRTSHQKIPERLDASLEHLWFATPVVDRDYILAGGTEWEPRSEVIRRYLTDPALHCK